MYQPVKRKAFIKWQKPNVRVAYALIAPAIASIYFFGWRSLLLLACVNLAGFITEYVFLRAYYKEPVTSAVFVTSFLFTLSPYPADLDRCSGHCIRCPFLKNGIRRVREKYIQPGAYRKGFYLYQFRRVHDSIVGQPFSKFSGWVRVFCCRHGNKSDSHDENFSNEFQRV